MLSFMAFGTLKLKALVNKEENKVIFVESGPDFVEILFSFLTMPIGEVVRLTRGVRSPKLQIGCMNNLYRSVEALDLNLFRSQMCRTMLLHPKNAAPFLCYSLAWSIGFGESMCYHYCLRNNCDGEGILSYYKGECIFCHDSLIGAILYRPQGEDFVDRMTRFLVSDELDVMTATSAASFPLFSKVQMKDIEERTFQFPKKEVLELLYYSLVSNKPLTETFLRPQSSKTDAVRGIYVKDEVQENSLLSFWVRKPTICIKLFVSKSKGRVCYAEASEEFIDLLFSFLTLPLGYAQKISGSGASTGCVGRLYKSVQNCFTTTFFKDVLLNPKIPKYFGYKNQLLGIEEVNYQFLRKSHLIEVVCATSRTSATDHTNLTLMDPKSVIDSEGNNGGFLKGHAMFTVTDDLKITPISPISSLSILNKLDVPRSDIEVLDVFVGEKEASHLLLAALSSESALTDVFLSEDFEAESILKETKKELNNFLFLCCLLIFLFVAAMQALRPCCIF